MTMRRSSVLAALAVCVTATEARADWQWTKWRMSEKELKEAAGALHMPLTQYPSRADATLVDYKSAYKAQGFDFNVSLTLGQNHGLLSVTLYPKDSADCARLRTMLRNSVYGEPWYESPASHVTSSLMWEDKPNGNQVEFSQSGVAGSKYLSCSVRYTELPLPGKSGL